MTTLPPTDLAERLFQGLLHLLGGAPQPAAPPTLEVMDARDWSRAYAREYLRMGSALPPSQALQRGMDRWVTAFPEAPEHAARADVESEGAAGGEPVHGGDTVPAAFMAWPNR